MITNGGRRAGRFLEDVKGSVPYYEEMTGKIIALLQTEWPRRILDLGSGAGNIDMKILDTVAAARIDCVEASPEMVQVSLATLGRHLDRATLIHKDVMDFNPEGVYDAIISNLVLRTMTREEKARLLARVRGWLAPGGLFVWGDRMITGGKESGQHKTSGRLPALKIFGDAIRRGAKNKPNSEASENDYDHPLTEEAMTALASEAGFTGIYTAWKRGSFAVLSMRK